MTGERLYVNLGAATAAVVESEFASVSVQLDTDGNAPRLRVTDLRTGRSRVLDALELEALAWLDVSQLHVLVDPSHQRWRD